MENRLGLLRIRIHRGINLAIRDLRSSDPYVVVKMGKQKVRTRVVRKNLNPEWNEELTVCVTEPILPIKLYVEAVMTMMWDRHLKYPYHYDQSDIILDMVFLTNVKKYYYDMETEATKHNLPFDIACKTYEFDDDFLQYAHEKLPYPGGRCWTGAERIFVVLNINENHYVTVLFDMVQAKVFVYDCNHGVKDDEHLLPIMTPVLFMFPIYVRNFKLFKKLAPKCKKLEMWPFDKVPIELCPQNLTAKSCGVYIIEHLITNTPHEQNL